MQLRDRTLLFSPSDLNAFLECEHLTALELARARGELDFEPAENPQRQLVAHKGDEHELAYLEALLGEGLSVAEIELGDERWDLERAARETLEAMRAGVDVVYQAAFVRGGWRGFADFLLKTPGASALGDYHYEPADTKLARHVKPYFVLQLCFYAEALAGLQGRAPERVHVVLGTRERESYRLADFEAYYRRVRARFLEFVQNGRDTYPLPVPHCPLCDFKELCERRWVEDDHLTLVAGMRRDQVRRLEALGVTTLTRLASATDDRRPSNMHERTFDALREQAALQLSHRRTGEHVTRLLPPEPGRGFALLPPPSPGDLFFDIEGDPFWAADRGLEYLFGITEVVDGEPVFRPFWAHDRASEKRALEDLVDLVHERLRRDPNLHVYHYASYEPSALKRLMGEYGTREDEIDDLLRRGVFVDLFKVVRQALRHSHPRYSLKNVETFYLEREAELQAGDDSILMYERWREERDPEILEAIRAYNEEDCRSTLELRDWLLGLKAEAQAQYGQAIEWVGGRKPDEEPPEREPGREELRQRLLAGLPEVREGRDADQQARWLAAQLLGYHRREAKPVWWAFFDRLGRTWEELAERDADAIGGLVPAGEPVAAHNSILYPFAFPAQEHKLAAGDGVYDPATGRYAGSIDALDDEHGTLTLRRKAERVEEPLPDSLIPGGPIRTRPQQAALRRLAESIEVGDGRYRALEAILRRDLPRIRGVDAGAELPQDDLAAARLLAASLDRSYLVVQGPPGSGKTWTGARMIVELIRRGRRVGVAATSHKAIHNLLEEVERVAVQEGVRFRGLKKGDRYEGAFVTTEDDQGAFSQPDDDVLLLAGTAWLFSRDDMEEAGIDTLFVDEAGQVALADALAMGTCARNLVLLGDPQQLAQVSQGTHPEGAGVSVLEHLRGEEQTIPRERGLFLGLSFRMHPDVCAFVSTTSYEGRLHSAEECVAQGTSVGTGLRFLPVEHEGNRGSSVEEAERVAEQVERLVGETWTDANGVERPIRYEDVLVVAPYNAQVRCLRRKLPERVRVGTVDKFQGQQAPVVFFSMATSSALDLPRNLEFLFSRNRLNVAVSRARCLAYLVASPRLLEVGCRTVEQMRMVNALCRFVEVAEAQRVAVR